MLTVIIYIMKALRPMYLKFILAFHNILDYQTPINSYQKLS